MATTVSEIMTKNPIYYTVPSGMNEVVKVLIKNNITGLPIADGKGKYVGIISRKDIFDHSTETQTAMVMRKAKAVFDDDLVEVAAAEMVKQHRRHIAVINHDNEITGILTPQNFLPVVKERYGNVQIRKVLMNTTIPVWEKTPINVVLFTMKLSRVYASPVINDKTDFVGLITDRDIFDKVDMRSQLVFSEAGIADDEDPWSWGGLRNVFTYMIERSHLQLPEIPVEEIMVKEPAVVYSNDRLESAVRTMEVKNYNQLPVLEGHDRLTGMLNDIEIMSVFHERI